MVRLSEVFARHGGTYLSRYGSRMLPSHHCAMESVTGCRTGAFGSHISVCERCGREHLFYHSCRHRACPRCQGDATERWLDAQRSTLMEAPYFHLVFTLPEELRGVVRRHQKALLSALFRSSWESLRELCLDAKHLGGKVGMLSAVHTWSRTMVWHPHVHCLVPGVGIGPDGVDLKRSRRDFLVPVRALSLLFRGKYMSLARRALPEVTFPQSVWRKPWVVYSKPTLWDVDRVLSYLGRYIHRTALTDSRIIGVGDREVAFRYQDSESGKWRVQVLDAHEFIRRFLQHVPPRGFHRVRTYGLLHPRNRSQLHVAQLALSGSGTARRKSPSPPSQACLAGSVPASDAAIRASGAVLCVSGPPASAGAARRRGVSSGRCPSCGEGPLHPVRWFPPSRGPPVVEAGQAGVSR